MDERRISDRIGGEQSDNFSPGDEKRETGNVLGVLDALRDLFGLPKEAGTDPLDEFGDCPPLSISSAYFSVWGQPRRL
jgi:hypothetical protein